MKCIDRIRKEGYREKGFFCYRCLSRIRWVPNPLHIQDRTDLQNRPERERNLATLTHGISPKEFTTNPYLEAREYGIHAMNPDADHSSVMRLFHQHMVEWREEDGRYVPYCPNCSIPLRNQDKWFYLKSWLKYPLIVALLGFSLWLASVLLGREALFGG